MTVIVITYDHECLQGRIILEPDGEVLSASVEGTQACLQIELKRLEKDVLAAIATWRQDRGTS